MQEHKTVGIPLTGAQYQIWLGASVSGREGLYPLSALLRFPGETDPACLRWAARALTQQAEALRLRVCENGGSPGQYCAPAAETACPETSFPTAQELETYFERRARQSIPLDGPLSQQELLFAPGEAAFLLRVHHIAADGAGLLLLLERYCALCAGAAVPPLPSFLSHAQNHPAQLTAGEEDRAFWRSYLEGAALDVKPRPQEPGPSLDADWMQRDFSAALSEGVRACAGRLDVTPFAVFLAVFSLWIARACGTKDVTVYVPRLGRDTQEARRTPGMFTLAVPVRLRVEEDESFAALCRRAQAQSRAAAAHKHCGLSAILSDMESAGGGGALSHFTLSFYNAAIDTHGLPVEAELRFAPAMTNLLTLHVSDFQGRGRYRFQCDSRSGWWQPGEAQRLRESMELLLCQAAEKPETACRALPILADAEKQRLAALLAGPAAAPSAADTIHGLFARVAAQHKNDPALFCTDQTLTYGALDTASETVCRNLTARGIRRGDIVALEAPRTSFAPVAMLGILKAGAAFLPIDPVWPQERRRFLLTDSGARLLICPQSGDAPCPTATPAQLLAAAPDGPATPAVNGRDLAYVIYTSGTTGTPKGVLVEHHGLVNLAQPEANPFNRDLARHGRALAAMGNFTFDLSIFELFIPLLNGVPVALANEEEARDPEALAALITRHGVNALHCTPARLLNYLEVPAFHAAMAGVELVLSAGETITRPLLEALTGAGGPRVYNGYGPTEATIGATLGPVDGELTIGRPMAGVRVYLLDEEKRLVPAGARGEIAIGGAGVARGYLNRPALDAEKFCDWADGLVSDRIYRTGDYGWCLPDGRLMFCGREDGQVKLRGLRIELAEIEQRIGRFPGVRQCAVLVKKVDGREHLCCYYAADTAYDAGALREYAGAFLTRYMVPDWFFHLEQLPQTPNGKTDRRALAALPVKVETSYTPPATPLEETLCGIFAAVLGRERVGAGDSFFDAGGTSLLAARAVLLCKHEGLAVEYAALFEQPTPRGLAALLESGPRRPAGETACTPEDGARIRAALRANTCYKAGVRPLGRVLLTGATGFLGIHILWQLLTATDAVVYCPVRPKGSMTPEKRLKGSLFYYFEDSFAESFGKRLFAVSGDVCAPDVAQLPQGTHIDTVLNCAADVSHFGVGGTIRRTNADGASNLAQFCLRTGAALVHVSTMSVGGFIPSERAAAGVCLSERELWLGQDLSNEYLASKFEAEKKLLLARERGLRVKIMRVGNLQGRASDGEFQINRAANGFTQLLRAMVRTGKCPRSLAESAVNFSPVDAVAKAICLLAGAQEAYTVFHVFDSNVVPVTALLTLLPGLGHPVTVLPDDAFAAFLQEAAAGEAAGDVSGFLTRVSGGALVETPCESAFSIDALAREGFCWPMLNEGYLRSCLEGLETLGFFE